MEPSVESLLESPNAELSVISTLLSILQDHGKTSVSKKKEPRYKYRSYYV